MAILSLLAAGSACGPSRAALLADVERLLAADSVAHLSGDAAGLAALVADTVVSVDGGGVTRLARSELERGFADYFAATEILAWQEPVAPIVRLSPDGSTAWVSRAVSMARETSGLGGRTVSDTVTLAWTANLERVGSEWRIVGVTTTTRDPEPSLPRLLAGVHRAIGWADGRAVFFRAAVAWAGPPYQVEILSAATGEARLAFDGGATLAITRDSGIAKLSQGPPAALSDTLETFLRGHDLFFNLVQPRGRFRGLRVAGTARFAERTALMVTGTDALGGVTRLYYDQADSLPLGYEVEDHLRGGGTVTTEIVRWADRDGQRLPAAVRFRQGREVFDYAIRELAIRDSAPDSLFLRVPGEDS
ncbi:MAG: hypothetical protein R2909_19775 [Gemmatimonadales bacterium]